MTPSWISRVLVVLAQKDMNRWSLAGFVTFMVFATVLAVLAGCTDLTEEDRALGHTFFDRLFDRAVTAESN